MRKHTFILGIVFTFILVIGLILKILHLPGANELIILGNSSFVLIFSAFYLIDRLRVQQRKAFQLSTVLLLISIQLFMIASIFIFLRWPGGTEMTILSLISFCIYFVFFSTQTEDRKLQLRRNRQLAAILFTDVIGFTAMMGKNEQQSLLALENNKNIQKRIIGKYRGKWLKEMGDGSLVIFFTATEAIAAAVEIQHKIQQSENFNIRMGIHLAEIVFTNSDVYGDGVNVASRISDEADANEITISDAVYQNIRNREDLNIIPLGEIELKNVNYPLRIYRVDTGVTESNIQ